MIIRVSEIESETKVTGTLDGSRFREEKEETDVAFSSPAAYELHIRKKGAIIEVSGPVRCVLTLACSKCMEEFAFPVEAVLDMELAPRTLMPSASELELTGEDLDVCYYEGDEIDLDPFVYDEIMLNVPIKPVCSEDCKGLCEICGANRNREECRCSAAPRTLLGEKLKSFLN